ncbi:hypothetical protein JCM19232_4221 [Vibrio ishigakensis]|uniref:Uncharacterized protein n=1 Tax=Vibrio ishigakensis TaxID=1481914 RepID=A0A0B8PG02_9VIBR|nr:hypothetical protein JCM19232_4221 [Vibrio ishigakensis]
MDDIKVGREVLSVIRDLQFIMNDLSAELRVGLADTHHLISL